MSSQTGAGVDPKLCGKKEVGLKEVRSANTSKSESSKGDFTKGESTRMLCAWTSPDSSCVHATDFRPRRDARPHSGLRHCSNHSQEGAASCRGHTRIVLLTSQCSETGVGSARTHRFSARPVSFVGLDEEGGCLGGGPLRLWPAQPCRSEGCRPRRARRA